MKKKLLISLFILLITLLSLSYGTLIYSSPTSKATSLIIGDLTYGIDITASNARVDGKTVNVSSNTTSIVNLKVTSLNEVETKYGIDYKILSGTGTVKYASNTGWLPTGKISKTNTGSYEKIVRLVIQAETDLSVDFTVSGGYTINTLNETKEGYTRVTEVSNNIISYNDTLINVTKKEANNNIYGGESVNNYLQYPVNDDNTKNIWRIIGYYNGIGTKIISNKTSSTSKTTLQTDLTNFYNTLEKQDRFILNTDKFNCTTSSCTSSSYSKIGLISVNEYNTLGGINSYLSSTDNFFALDNNTIKSITPTGVEESETSGLKPTIYLQDYVTVTGTGTVGDPFKLKLPEYTVTVNVVNGSTTLPSKMITRGEDATYTLTPNTGYKNVIQSDTCKGTYSGNTYTISDVTENKNCTITFAPETYTLTLDVNGGNALSINTKTITYNSTYGELPTPTRTGYTFNGWYYGSTKITSSTKVTLTSNHTLKASWTANNYTLTFNPNGGSVSTTSKTVTFDSTYGELPTPTRTGYTFNGWNYGSTKIISSTKVTTSSNHTLNANWSVNSYAFKLTKGTGISTIYYRINGSSSYSSTSSNVSTTATFGTTYSYYGVASTGYTISTCTQSSPCSATIGTSGVNATLSATLNKYNVTLSVSNGSGSTTKSVSHGSSVSFTVTPSSGYLSQLKTNSCGGTLSGSTYIISNVTGNKTCSISFKKDIPTLYVKLLTDKSSRSVTTRPGGFSSVYTSDNTKTLYTSTENGTTVYYFAGNSTDNWVKFGGYYWRIIRTNADGGIRLLYHSTSTTATNAYIINSTAFNSASNNSVYVGYMHGLNDNSTIKDTIDTWYANNLTNYTKYLSTTAIYCNDRTSTVSFNDTKFGAYNRLRTNKTPTYDCTNTSDAFSVSNTSAKLDYPIGLMTADEVSFAGGVNWERASTYYYYNSVKGSSTGKYNWYTMSPSDWNGDHSYVFLVDGSDNPGYLSNEDVYYKNAVRPAISLKSCVKYGTGDGSAGSPYTIDESYSC